MSVYHTGKFEKMDPQTKRILLVSDKPKESSCDGRKHVEIPHTINYDNTTPSYVHVPDIKIYTTHQIIEIPQRNLPKFPTNCEIKMNRVR